MPRGYALVLTLLVLAAALFAGWFSTTRVVYFAPNLLTQSSGCSWIGGDEPIIDQFEADWYGSELRAFEEPSLYLASLEPHAGHRGSIRFTWIRSFHEPVVVRIDRASDGAGTLTAKQRPGGTGFSGQGRTLRRALTSSEENRLGSVLATTRVLDQKPKTCDGGLDGARWIIEATDGSGTYTYLNRWSPRDGPVKELGEFMIGLTGWDVDPIY